MKLVDYIEEETGLLHCGLCRTPKQLELHAAGIGSHVVSIPCRCQSEKQEEIRRKQKERENLYKVQRLKSHGIQDPYLREWTFEKDNGRNPQMEKARQYVAQWPEMKQENIGLLFWGGVGSGKSFAAACIANALIEQRVPVLMTNFPKILHALSSMPFEDRNAYVQSLSRYALLIIDDLGVERNTEYALEQVFHIIDSRYRSGKPLIITSNLHLDVLEEPEDIAHERIYSRILERCVPIRFAGENFRKENAKENMSRAIALFRKGAKNVQ